jgi:hypothetical protein
MVSPLVGLLRSLGSAAEDEQEGSTGKTVQ